MEFKLIDESEIREKYYREKKGNDNEMLEEEFLKSGLSFNTIKSYENNINQFLDWLGDRDIIFENAELFLIEKKKNNLAESSLGRLKAALNFYFYKILGIEGEIDFKAKKIRKLPIILTKDEIQLILENSLPYLRLFFEILLSSGIRIDEFMNLRFIDFDLENLFLKVNFLKAKGSKERTTVISSDVRDLLKKLYYKKLNSNEFIATFSYSHYIKKLHEIAKKVGIQKRVYPHLLRHCFGTYHYKQFKDIVLLKELMGHESIISTQLYVTLSGEDIKDAKSPDYSINN